MYLHRMNHGVWAVCNDYIGRGIIANKTQL